MPDTGHKTTTMTDSQRRGLAVLKTAARIDGQNKLLIDTAVEHWEDAAAVIQAAGFVVNGFINHHLK